MTDEISITEGDKRDLESKTPLSLIAGIAFSIQLAVLLAWSFYIWHRYALTWDFSIYYQAGYLIAHGHYDPYSSALGFRFYQNDFELLLWPVGMLLKVFPSSFTMLALQDMAIAGANYIGFRWLEDIVCSSDSRRDGRVRLILGIGLTLFMLSPWIYSAAGFDWHVEPMIMPIAVYLGWQLWKGNVGRSVVASFLLLLGGNVAATYLVGLGVSNIGLSGSGRRLAAGISLVMGLAAILVIEHVVPGGMRGGNIAGIYGYLLGPDKKTNATAFSIAIGLIEHPGRAVRVLEGNAYNLYGAVAPGGIVGFFSLPVVGIAMVVLLTAGLIPGHLWSSPLNFQTLLVSPFVTVGTAGVLAKWRRKTGLHYIVSTLVVLNCVGWALAWMPQLPNRWVRISAPQARTLHRIQNTLDPNVEVVASSSVVGRFSNRQWIYTFSQTEKAHGDSLIPIHYQNLDFLITPNSGIDSSSERVELARLKYLMGLRGSRLRVASNGIYEISWRAPKGMKYLLVPSSTQNYPVWALGGTNAIAIESGPPSRWHLASKGVAGYVEKGFYERLRPGRYKATVTLATTGPVSLEVWNSTGNVILARDWIPASATATSFSEYFTNRIQIPVHSYTGFGIFHITPLKPRYDQIEVRVWAPSKVLVNVYGLGIQQSQAFHFKQR